MLPQGPGLGWASLRASRAGPGPWVPSTHRVGRRGGSRAQCGLRLAHTWGCCGLWGVVLLLSRPGLVGWAMSAPGKEAPILPRVSCSAEGPCGHTEQNRQLQGQVWLQEHAECMWSLTRSAVLGGGALDSLFVSKSEQELVTSYSDLSRVERGPGVGAWHQDMGWTVKWGGRNPGRAVPARPGPRGKAVSAPAASSPSSHKGDLVAWAPAAALLGNQAAPWAERAGEGAGPRHSGLLFSKDPDLGLGPQCSRNPGKGVDASVAVGPGLGRVHGLPCGGRMEGEPGVL